MSGVVSCPERSAGHGTTPDTPAGLHPSGGRAATPEPSTARRTMLEPERQQGGGWGSDKNGAALGTSAANLLERRGEPE